MTRDEVKELLMTFQVKYQNFKVPSDKASFVINAWYEDLERYPYEAVKRACAAYRDTANAAFAPSTSQIIGLIKGLNVSTVNASDAWAITHKAICSSRDEMEETFAKLPVPIQRAIGSPRMLREWSMLDSEEIHNSIHPRFLRSYEVAVKESEMQPYMSSEVRMALEEKVYKHVPQIEAKQEEVYGMSEATEKMLKEFLGDRK